MCQEHLSPSRPPQYAFLVTAAVQFAGGIVIFFGLLVSPEEIGERLLFYSDCLANTGREKPEAGTAQLFLPRRTVSCFQ